MKFKKLIAVCLTIVMVCTMMCIPAFASSGTSEYAVDRDFYTLNESYSPGSEIFVRLTVRITRGDQLEILYYEFPVDLEYLSYDDSQLDYNGIMNLIEDTFSRSYDLGYFDLSDASNVMFELALFFSAPDGSYQVSCSAPFSFYRVTIGEVSRQFRLKEVNVYDNGYVGSIKYSGPRFVSFDHVGDSRISLSLSETTSIAMDVSGFRGLSGNLIVDFTPFYLYFGEPLEDGFLYPPPAPIKDFMGNVSTIFHNVINWVALTAETIVSNPLILIFSIVPYIGLGVSIYARIKRTKK